MIGHQQPDVGFLVGSSFSQTGQIDGMVPAMFCLPEGCAFEERCHQRIEKCKHEQPAELKQADGRYLRCLNVGESHER